MPNARRQIDRRLSVLGHLIGGFDLAAERMGMTVAWQSEIEPYACKVLAHRFAGVPNLGDVTRIEDAPPVDIITFGFPCQDLSVAGKRAGMGGARSGLFFEAIRIIERVRPAIAVAENVPGLLSSNRGRDLAAVLGALADIGALDIGWRVLDAQHFGVPQRRRRVFIVCDFAGERAVQILALAAGGDGHPAPRRATGQATAATLRSRSHGAGVNPPRRGGEDDDNLIVAPSLIEHLLEGPGGGVWVCPSCAHVIRTEMPSCPRCGRALPYTHATHPLSDVANALTASNGHHGHSSPRGDGSDNLVAFYPTGGSRGVGNNVDISPPLKVGTGLDIAQWAAPAISGIGGVRRLTPCECEALQGFPSGWTCPHDHPQPCDCADGARYRCLGNAVAVPVAEWLLGRIAGVAP